MLVTLAIIFLNSNNLIEKVFPIETYNSLEECIVQAKEKKYSRNLRFVCISRNPEKDIIIPLTGNEIEV